MEEKKNAWLLAEPLEGVHFLAEADGVWLRSDDLDAANLKNLRTRRARSRLGRLLPSLLPQLFELELAEEHGGAVEIPYADFIALTSVIV